MYIIKTFASFVVCVCGCVCDVYVCLVRMCVECVCVVCVVVFICVFVGMCGVLGGCGVYVVCVWAVWVYVGVVVCLRCV